MTDPYDALLSQPSAATGGVSADPYGELLGLDQQQRLKSTLNLAVATPPDQVAQQRKTAKQLGTPVAAVEALPEDAKRAAAVQTVDVNTANAPVLRKRYTDADFAKLAHDDSGVLAKLEAGIGGLGRLGRYLVSADDNAGLVNDVKAGFIGAESGAAGLFRAGTEVAAPLLDFLEADPSRGTGDWRTAIGGNPLRRLAEGFGAIAQSTSAAQKAAGSQVEGNLMSGLSSGVQSLTQNLIMMPAALMTGGESVALIAMAALTGGTSYQKARESGVNPYTAGVYAASDAVVEFATEKLPMHRLLGDLKAGMPFFQTLARNAALEIPGEQIATILQDANEWATLHPEKSVRDYLRERPDAAVQTLIATIVGVGGQVTLMQAAQKAVDNINGRTQQVHDAEQFGNGVQQMLAEAGQSKLRERAPDEFAATVQQMADETGGAPSAVYADARLLADALAQSGLSQEQLAQSIPNTLAALREALVQNGSVAIPTGELLATAPGTPLEQSLLPILRQSEDGLSQLEAKEAGQQAEQFVQEQTQRVLDQTAQRQLHDQQTAEIKQTITDQLNAAGRFRPEANDTYATMVGAFYSTMAQRLGTTPAELYARYPLRVTGEMQAGALEQAGTPAFNAWFGDSKVVDAEGKPLVVYHGTTSDFDVFDRTKTGKGPSKLGFWLTDMADFAENFGNTLMPAYVTLKNPKKLTPAQWDRIREQHGGDAGYFSKMRDDLIAQGFDGVMVPGSESQVGRFSIREPAVYAAFNSEQIKSATGNRGTYDPNSPNILEQQTRATFSPEQMLIALGPNADYSSFLHEMGHAWLEILNDIATQPGAPQQIVDDMNAVLKWFGIKGTEQVGGADAGGVLAQGVTADDEIDAREIEPLHEVRDDEKYDVLVRNMEAGGWVGRPLLVYADEDGELRAVTGSHRLAAAKRVRVDVPVVYVSDAALAYEDERGLFGGWGDVVGRDDDAVAAFLRQAGDLRAADLMDAEVASNNDGYAQGGAPTQPAPIRAQRTPMETWAAMTLDQKRPYHERWAESVEQYFFEGKAPSVELRGVFDRFRTWLMSVYKSLTRFLAMRAQTPGGQTGALAQSVPEEKVPPRVAEVFAENGGVGDIDESTDIRAKSFAFAAMAEAEGFTVSDPGAKYFIISKSLGQDAQGYERAVEIPVRVSDHSNVNRGVNFGGSVINIAPDDGYARDTFASALWKLRNTDVNEDGDTTINGKPRDDFAFYQSDNTAGPLNLTDEIRAVMDRLLATDEQIQQAEAVRQYGLLFKSPEEAGMTPEQWAAYTSEDAKAHAAAMTELSKKSLRNMGIVTRKRMRALKEVQADMAEKRKAVEAEAAAIVAKEPVYQAMRWLKRGEMTTPDGEEVKVANGFKLDRAGVDAIFPESMPGRPDLTKLKGMTLKEGGLDPAIVAEMFGFRDGAHLIASIVDAFPQADQVDGLTDQMMLERYGDAATPRGMERAADEAVHNENRARVLAAEMAAVSAANNARAPGQNGRTVNAMVAAAKQFAERLVAGKKVKDLKPQQHTAAETRAARAAEKALAKGDTEGVVVAKRDQLLNFHAAKATNEARIEAAKIGAFFKRIATAKDDVAGKTRDIDVVKAAQAILATYGVTTEAKGRAAVDYMATLEANDPAMFAAVKPSINAALSNAKPLDELTMGELRALNEELQALWYLAKRSRQMEVDGNLLDIQDAADDLKARMVDIGIPDTMPGDSSAITPAEQRALKLKGFLAAARRVESWTQAKDGTGRGPFRRLVWEPVREAADRYRAEKAKVLKAFKALLEPVAPTLTKRQIDAPELGYTFGKDTDGVALAEILHAILHTGNESNKRKLLLGRKWATENADGMLDTAKWDIFIARMVREGVLTKAHFDFAQGVWDLLETTKPLAQKAHRDAFGRYFAEVTADEFTDPFGVKRRGGYVPAQADARIVSDQATRRLMEDENAGMQFAFPTTSKGFTKSRVEYSRPLLLDLRALTQHIDKVLLFSHLENPVRDARKLLTNKGVAYGLNRLDPVAFDAILTPWLNRAAKQQVETPVAGDAGLMRFFSALRRRAGMAAMFANVANAAQQLAGFSLAAVKVKPAELARATAQYVAAPRETTEMVADKSTYMATRMENEVANMTDAINDILLDPSVYDRTKTFLAKHSYFLQSAVDNVTGPIIWTGAYNQALEQGMEDRDAVRYADSAIRETQGSTSPEDVSRIETGNAFVRLFTQFAGYFNMQANLLGTEFKVLARDIGLRKGLGRGLYVLVFGYLVNAWVAEAIMQAFKGGPDDEDKDGDYFDNWLAQIFGWSLVRNATAMVPVAGPMANALINTTNNKPYDDRISTSPAISMVESAVKVPSDVYKVVAGKDVKPSSVVRDLATLISMLTGIPANAFAKPVGYVADVQAGKVAPTSTADAARGAVTGTASPESKR